MPSHARGPRLAILLCGSLVSLAAAPAQQPDSSDPLEAITRAEKLFAGPDRDQAILCCWEAIDRLRSRTDTSAVAGVQKAMASLAANDPLHGDRLAASAAFARAQVDLAMLYRSKKWYAAAFAQLEDADRFDPGAGTKERAQLAAARPEFERGSSRRKPATLLQRSLAARAEGPWQEQGDTLVCGEHAALAPWFEWVVDVEHEDCELSIEFRSSDALAGHDCALLVGLDRPTFFYQVIAAYYPHSKSYDLTLLEWDDGKAREIASIDQPVPPTADGVHRLVLRVHGLSLRAQIDDTTPLEGLATIVPRGRIGITVGIHNQASVPITLRKLCLQPWPPLTPDQVRANVEKAAQKRVAAAIDSAFTLLCRKENEAASLRLREATRDVWLLPPGAPRTAFTKDIDEKSIKADLLHDRRKQIARDGARALLAIADRYAAAGQPRAALRLVELVAEVAPEHCTDRLAAARNGVEPRPKTPPR